MDGKSKSTRDPARPRVKEAKPKRGASEVPPRLLSNHIFSEVAAFPLPVVTRTSELPLHALTWENFERLCVALFLKEAEVVDCRFHGRQGSQQDGIDLLASRRDGGTSAIQCKRVKVFGPSDLSLAVSKFLKGPWVKRVDEFIICTSHDTRLLTEAVERSRRRLYGHDISFTVLDSFMLSHRLRAYPDIVADFFGHAWMEVFCGGHAISPSAPPPESWKEALTEVLTLASNLNWNIAPLGKKLNNLRFSRNVHFKGRKDELADIHRLLQKSAAVAVTQAVAVHGLGGIGKTQLANEYAWLYADHYSALLWVSADSPTALFNGLGSIVRGSNSLGQLRSSAVELSAQVEAGVRSMTMLSLAAATLTWLETQSGWLLILDNADTPEMAELISELLPRLRNGRLIVTSRRSVWHESFVECRLGVLSPDEALDYMMVRCPDAGGEALARRLVQRLGRLPLALAQAAACIRAEGLSFSQYLMELKSSQRLAVLRRLPEGALSYPKPVAETWAITVGRLDEEARMLLQIFSWLAPDSISRGLVEGKLQIGDDPTPKTCRKALNQLAEYSLVDLSPRKIAVHRLLQAITQDTMTPQERHRWLRIALQLVASISTESLNADNIQEWDIWEMLAPHGIEVLEHAQNHGLVVEEVTEIGHQLTRYLLTRSRYTEALPLACRVVAVMRKRYGRGHQHVASALSAVASALADGGRLEKALVVQKKVLEIDRKACGSASEAVGEDLSALGVYLMDLGRNREAEPVLRKAVELCSRFMSRQNPNLIIARTNLASILYDNASYREALDIYRDALRRTERLYGQNHPEVCTILNGVALVCIELRQIKRAARNISRALAIARQHLGRQNAMLPLYMNTAARVEHASGNLRKAATWQKKSLALCEEIHGEDHPSTLSSLGNMASIYQEMDRLREARRCFEEVARREERVFGPDDPRLANRLSNLADLHHRLGGLSEAESIYRRVLALEEKSKGIKHIEVAEDLRHLAQVLFDRGKHAEARSLLKRALQIYRSKPSPKKDGHQWARQLLDQIEAF
jgi:tetratricopeptide (TPR) repeat protein